MTSNQLRSDERKALELLPWYVNGTLEGDERELVSRQVLSSLTCRKELERLRRLQQLIQRDDRETAAADRAFERLMARIKASGASDRPPANYTERNPPRTRFALAACLAAAVSALLSWWWYATPTMTPQVYETLTRSQPTYPGAMRLRVLFAPGVSETERQDLLARHGLTVVGPPTEDGIFTLAFAGDSNPTAVVAALKRDPRIRLVTTPPVPDAP
jgi:hypothetical protein